MKQIIIASQRTAIFSRMAASIGSLVLLFIFGYHTGFAAEEVVIKSRSGKVGKPIVSTSTGISLGVADQWYSYMLANPSTYTNIFDVAKAGSRVTLRWDDSKRVKFATPWKLIVTYNLKQYDATGLSQTFTGETITIFYNPAEGAVHSQKSVNTYFHTSGAPGTPYKSYKSELTVTGVTYCSDNSSPANCTASTSSTLPSTLDDVFLDLEQVTERYYQLDIATSAGAPSIQYADGFNPSSPANNELSLTWNYVRGAESYDLEWVFVDATTFDVNNNFIALSLLSMPYTFKDATRINTTNNYYNIPLVFPRGVLMYRIRSVGNYSSQSAIGTTVTSLWSYDPVNPNVNQNTQNQSNRYDVNGMNLGINWQHSVAFAEQGKRKDVLNLLDGSLRSRQAVALLNTNNDAIVSETKYDHEGRPALNFLPTPVRNTGTIYKGLDYYSNFNAYYDRSNFDVDTKVISPDAVPNTNGAAKYYGQNTIATGADAYTPDAQGFPYTRTRYKTDGTGRLRSQGGLGLYNKLGSGHEVQYVYGSPSQDELDKLFGNEVGYAKHYQKKLIKDANGQVSVSYLDQEGRTIATAIAGSPGSGSPLLGLDNIPTAAPETLNILKNNIVDNKMVVSAHTEAVEAPGDYHFVYTISQSAFAATCLASSGTTNENCTYDLELSVLDEDGNLVPTSNFTYYGNTCSPAVNGNPIVCAGLTSGNYDFKVNLGFGSYTIKKVLTISQATIDAYKQNYIDQQNQNHYCVHVPQLAPMPCTNDCNSACREQYIIRDETTGIENRDPIDHHVIFYDPSTGLPISPQSDSTNLINACITSCSKLPTKTLCDVNHDAIVADMSPGGQYFDNAPFKYKYDANGNLTANTLYNINDWLVLNAGGGISDIKTYNTSHGINNPAIIAMSTSNTSSNWDIIRANWYSDFGPVMMVYHPEYWAYTANCGAFNYRCFGNVYMDKSIGFDNSMSAVTDNTSANSNGYFNPTGVTQNSTHSANFYADNSTYEPYNPMPGGAIDTYFAETSVPNGCPVDCELTFCGQNGTPYTAAMLINEYLQKFLAVPGLSNSYYSIWYVLDNPHNYNLLPNGTTNMDTTVRRMFITLYGDGTNPGIIGSGTGQITKYQFFLHVYQYFKQLLINAAIKQEMLTNGMTMLNDAGNGYSHANGSVSPYTSGGNLYGTATFPPYFQIRIVRNAIFDAFPYTTGQTQNYYPDLCPGGTSMLNIYATSASTSGTNQCQTECDGYADDWMKKIALVYDLSTLTSTQVAKMRTDLVSVCALNCDGNNNPDGKNPYYCGTCSSYPTCTTCTPNTAKTFEDVINYYFPSNSNLVHIIHPQPDNGSCSCANFNSYVESNYTMPFASTILSDIATDFNTNFGTSGITSNDVKNWANYCQLSLDPATQGYPSGTPQVTYNLPVSGTPPVHSQLLPHYTTPVQAGTSLNLMPDGIYCPDTETLDSYNPAICGCENLNYFINAFKLDPTTDQAIIVSHLNDALLLSGANAITVTQLNAWLTECANSNPNNTNLATNGFPTMFSCPIPASSSDDDMDVAAESAACVQENLDLTIDNSASSYLSNLDVAASSFINDYKAYCISSLDGRESFAMDYNKLEFLYTLYFYDQAGNLIKTVPPLGVVYLNSSQIQAAQAHRANPTNPSYPAVFTSHGLITDYKYNSLQQVIDQTTPDGGHTTFFYDAVGRSVVSQNDNQRITSSSGSSITPYNTNGYPSYSYTMYDELGRVIETGELQNQTPITNNISRSKASTTLANWLSNSANYVTNSKRQVTQTYYDAYFADVNGYFASGQENLRSRIASVVYTETNVPTYNAPNNVSNIPAGYNNASHYSYDIHGNVKSMVQENKDMFTTNNSTAQKTINYEYDLVSGNTNAMHYQTGKPDQLHYKYFYDPDNRINEAYTSTNDVIYNKDAKYFFYPHGPLARTELGNYKVTGLDYIYTIQGWLKGVNSNTLYTVREVGKDGLDYSVSNKFFGTDAYGYTLGYFNGDYLATAITASVEPTISTSSPLYTNRKNLYNGNISMMATSLEGQHEAPYAVNGNLYQYDQLNRIKLAQSYTDANLVTSNTWSSGATTNSDKYKETFSYDFNGNITAAYRKGDVGDMDNLTYVYDVNDKRNSLVGVNDPSIANTAYSKDIDDQNVTQGTSSTYNYKYDAIGNMNYDKQQEINNIEWTTYGKIGKIIRTSASTKADLEFKYDANGNRIVKVIKPAGSTTFSRTGTGTDDPTQWSYVYYVRDPRGMPIATYNKDHLGLNSDPFYLAEQNLYGSGRLGMISSKKGLDNSVTYPAIPVTFVDTVGRRGYEMNNHLSNVLSVVSDKKIAIDNGALTGYGSDGRPTYNTSPDGNVDNYVPVILNTVDYYAFGSPMPGRSYYNSPAYRYGFNGKENDGETVGQADGDQDYGMRIYNPALGRFLSVDPITAKYPELTPYQFASNRAIDGIDMDGLEYVQFQNNGKWYNISNLTAEQVEKLCDANKVKFDSDWLDKSAKNEYWTVKKYTDFYGNSTGTKISKYLSLSSYKNGQGKAYCSDWERNLAEWFAAYDVKLGKEDGWIEGLKLEATVVATIFSGGALATAEGVVGVTGASAAFIFNVDNLTALPSEETILGNLALQIGGENMLYLLKGAKFSLSVRDATKGLVYMAAHLSNGKTITGMWDAVNKIFTTVSGANDVREKAIELKKKSEEQSNAETSKGGG